MKNLKQTEHRIIDWRTEERNAEDKKRKRWRTKKVQVEKKRSSETEDHEKQRLATFKRLKRDDENELERKLR